MVLNPEEVFQSFQDAMLFRQHLDKVESTAIICIFLKYNEKLLIMQELLPGSSKKERMSDYKSLFLRMQIQTKISPSENKISDDMLSHIKKQICFLTDVFEETMIEIGIQGSYGYLEYTLRCQDLRNLDNITLKQESRDKRRRIDYLRETIKSKTRNLQETQDYLLESTGPCLQRAYVNVYVEEHSGKQFGCLREKTRIEKNNLKLKEKKQSLIDSIEQLDSETWEENHIHQELETHLSILLSELTEKVNYWSKKYSSEIEQMDVDLLQLQSKKDEQSAILQTMQEEFSAKQQLLDDLIEECEKNERETQRKIFENKAASTIQRWWKRILFMRKLQKKKNSDKKKSVKKAGTKKTGSKKK